MSGGNCQARLINQAREIGQNQHHGNRKDDETCLTVLRLFEHGQIPFLLMGRLSSKSQWLFKVPGVVLTAPAKPGSESCAEPLSRLLPARVTVGGLRSSIYKIWFLKPHVLVFMVIN
tara:strand:- start:129 stop:479 length:351 start_codon:yes stop_codon:yes gene_type:complete